jgi:hypothetical protein
MTGKERTKKRQPALLSRILTMICVVLCLVLGCGYLLVVTYARTPSAAHQVARLLTDYLHYPVSVAGFGFTGGTFSITGLTIGNPAGFRGGELVSARVITISPDWQGLLRGKKSFDGIVLEGLRVSIGRNEQGDWNFYKMAQLLSGQKKGGETLIKRLAISRSSLAVEGFRLENLSVTVNDLSTKGTTGSRFLLTCKDSGGNPVRLEGKARLGSAPIISVEFAAPSFPLQNLARSFGRVSGPDLADARGSFLLALQLGQGKVAAQGKLGVEHLYFVVNNRKLPVNARFDFTGSYDLKEDLATLDTGSLRLNGIALEASGTVRQVRKKRAFAATVAIARTDIKTVYDLFPRELRRDVIPGGTVGATVFRFSGDADAGVTVGKGALSLRSGELAKGGRLLVKDLSLDLSLLKVKEGWQVRGRLSQGDSPGGGALQVMNAPFTALFSNHLLPLHVAVPSFGVRILGLPAVGEFDYKFGAPMPLALRMEVRKAVLSRLNGTFPGRSVTFSAGTADLSLQATGRSLREFHGKMGLNVDALQGSAAGAPFAVSTGKTTAEFTGVGGKLSAVGQINCTGALIADKKVKFAVSFRGGAGEFGLSNGTLTLDQMEVRLAALHGLLPLPQDTTAALRFPVRMEFSGLSLWNTAARLDGMTGNLAADFVAGPGRHWLEGRGVFALPKLTWKGVAIGVLDGGINFADSGAVVNVRGKLLDGRLRGTATIDPFAPAEKSAFSMKLDAAHWAMLSAIAPDTLPLQATSGLLDVELTGSHERSHGLYCRVAADGSGITLIRKGGKKVLENAGVRTVSELAGDTLFIREGSVAAGNGIVLRGKGELAHPLSPDREGEITYFLPPVPIDALLTSLLNNLPRSLQEASATGTVGIEGRLRFAHKQQQLDGQIDMTKAGLEIPSQKFSAAAMTGTIPYSLVFAGTAGGGRARHRTFSRENFPALLTTLKQATTTGRTCTIGRIRFGEMEFGTTSLAIKAGDGLMELSSLGTGLFDGVLLGEGFFRYGRKIQYGADLTVNNLSLRKLCDVFPKIKGYLAGRVDGIMSLSGDGMGTNGCRGFMEIWTRSGPGEPMLVSKEFLQKLAGKKLKGIFFRNDRPYDRGEIRGYLENGYLTFDTLDISHTNLFGIQDLSVTVAPVQNRIALDHLFTSIKEAATRGKAVGGGEGTAAPPVETEFKWQE